MSFDDRDISLLKFDRYDRFLFTNIGLAVQYIRDQLSKLSITCGESLSGSGGHGIT